VAMELDEWDKEWLSRSHSNEEYRRQCKELMERCASYAARIEELESVDLIDRDKKQGRCTYPMCLDSSERCNALSIGACAGPRAASSLEPITQDALEKHLMAQDDAQVRRALAREMLKEHDKLTASQPRWHVHIAETNVWSVLLHAPDSACAIARARDAFKVLGTADEKARTVTALWCEPLPKQVAP
jgi:hypothetical protein